MNNICALTDEITPLRNSHIIPKFFFKDLQKKGGTYFKSTLNPKLEIKDGIKMQLLGEKAEQLFSNRENWFKKNIFDYYHKENKPIIQPIIMKDELYYFSISILWRIIQYIKHKHLQNDIKKESLYHLITNAEKEWKNYLYKGELPSTYSKIYIATLDTLLEEGDVDLQYYVKRIFDFEFITDDLEIMQNCAFWCKCTNFIFFADLLPHSSGNFEYGHLINNNNNYEKSCFIEDWALKDERLLDAIKYRSEVLKQEIKKNPISLKQENQIRKNISRKKNFETSELYQLLKSLK